MELKLSQRLECQNYISLADLLNEVDDQLNDLRSSWEGIQFENICNDVLKV